jgi:hypothetical protein
MMDRLSLSPSFRGVTCAIADAPREDSGDETGRIKGEGTVGEAQAYGKKERRKDRKDGWTERRKTMTKGQTEYQKGERKQGKKEGRKE